MKGANPIRRWLRFHAVVHRWEILEWLRYRHLTRSERPEPGSSAHLADFRRWCHAGNCAERLYRYRIAGRAFFDPFE